MLSAACVVREAQEKGTRHPTYAGNLRAAVVIHDKHDELDDAAGAKENAEAKAVGREEGLCSLHEDIQAMCAPHAAYHCDGC